MENNETICLLNDSFPPVIDGVANAVKNYADIIHQTGEDVVVVTPSHPESDDRVFPYPVIRYPSLDFRKMTGGYTAGIPFSPAIARPMILSPLYHMILPTNRNRGRPSGKS